MRLGVRVVSGNTCMVHCRRCAIISHPILYLTRVNLTYPRIFSGVQLLNVNIIHILSAGSVNGFMYEFYRTRKSTEIYSNKNNYTHTNTPRLYL